MKESEISNGLDFRISRGAVVVNEDFIMNKSCKKCDNNVAIITADTHYTAWCKNCKEYAYHVSTRDYLKQR